VGGSGAFYFNNTVLEKNEILIDSMGLKPHCKEVSEGDRTLSNPRGFESFQGPVGPIVS